MLWSRYRNIYRIGIGLGAGERTSFFDTARSRWRQVATLRKTGISGPNTLYNIIDIGIWYYYTVGIHMCVYNRWIWSIDGLVVMRENALTRTFIKSVTQLLYDILLLFCTDRNNVIFALSRSMARYFAQSALIYKSTFLVDAFLQQQSRYTYTCISI